jgi:hypothetical protein
MRLRRESTPELVDQEGSGVPGGAASLPALARRRAPDVERAEPRPRSMASGRRGRWTMARRASGWAMPGRGAMPGWIVHARSPKRGARLVPAAGGRASRRTGALPPRPSGPSRCGRGPAPRGAPRHGAGASGWMATSGACGWGWRPSPRPPSGWAGDHGRGKRSGLPGRRTAGRGSGRAMARKVRGGTPGAGGLERRPWRPAGAAGGWGGAVWARLWR